MLPQPRMALMRSWLLPTAQCRWFHGNIPPLFHSPWINTMNRCFPSPRLLRLTPQKWLVALLTCLASLAAMPVAAQSLARQFPAAALRGTLEVTTPPDILLNGRPERLSPGARIRGLSNTLVMSASLVGQPVLVNYLRDPLGLVHEVWILSAAEAQEKRATQPAN